MSTEIRGDLIGPIRITFWIVLLVAVSFLAPPPCFGDTTGTESSKPDLLDGLSFDGQWFLAFEAEEDDGNKGTNEFLLKRGYVTVKKKFDHSLSARVTQDIAVDHEGDGEGDIEVRLKYLYLKYSIKSWAVFHKPYLELGLVHRPWMDFEQKINHYRVQGTMFLERVKIVRSADYGITFVSGLGGETDKSYQSEVNSSYPGKYGSVAIGVYNGGGYEAIERNNNKLVAARLSIRPLPKHLTGGQISWLGGFGKGNSAAAPELTYHAIYLSIDREQYLVTYTGYVGVGDAQGEAVNDEGRPYDNKGHSFFAELRYPIPILSAFARYDRFRSELKPGSRLSERYIIGLACRFHGASKLVVDYDRLEINSASPAKESHFEIAVELNY